MNSVERLVGTVQYEPGISIPKIKASQLRSSLALMLFSFCNVDDEKTGYRNLLGHFDRFRAVASNECYENVRADCGWKENHRAIATNSLNSTTVEGIRIVLIENIHHGTSRSRRIVSISTAEATWVTSSVPVAVEGVERERRDRRCCPCTLVRDTSEVQSLFSGNLNEAQSVGQSVGNRSELASWIDHDFGVLAAAMIWDAIRVQSCWLSTLATRRKLTVYRPKRGGAVT